LTAVCVYLNKQKVGVCVPLWSLSMGRDIDDNELERFGTKLLGPEGFGIWVSNWRERISFFPIYPKNAEGKEIEPYSYEVKGKTLTLNVTETKRPELIARDIANKLLPDATEVFRICKKRVEAQNEHGVKQAALTALFADMLDSKAGRNGEILSGNISVECRADSVDMKLWKLSPDMAERIIKLVRGIDKWEGEE
jgi:hypothetical protein